jgi:hypothetical protein
MTGASRASRGGDIDAQGFKLQDARVTPVRVQSNGCWWRVSRRHHPSKIEACVLRIPDSQIDTTAGR